MFKGQGNDERATGTGREADLVGDCLSLVGGVSGEMWRADKDGARGWALLRRLALQSGACIVCGVSAMMLLFGAGLSIWTAGALGCLTAMAGADVAIGLYERWVAKRLDLSEAEPKA